MRIISPPTHQTTHQTTHRVTTRQTSQNQGSDKKVRGNLGPTKLRAQRLPRLNLGRNQGCHGQPLSVDSHTIRQPETSQCKHNSQGTIARIIVHVEQLIIRQWSYTGLSGLGKTSYTIKDAKRLAACSTATPTTTPTHNNKQQNNNKTTTKQCCLSSSPPLLVAISTQNAIMRRLA